MQAADGLLVDSPYDSAAVVLKARALMGLNREDEATAVLTKQIQAQPSDVGSLQLLSRIYVSRADWPKTMTVASRLAQLTPVDQTNGLLFVEAALRSGQAAIARQASFRLLSRTPTPHSFDRCSICGRTTGLRRSEPRTRLRSQRPPVPSRG